MREINLAAAPNIPKSSGVKFIIDSVPQIGRQKWKFAVTPGPISPMIPNSINRLTVFGADGAARLSIKHEAHFAGMFGLHGNVQKTY